MSSGWAGGGVILSSLLKVSVMFSLIGADSVLGSGSHSIVAFCTSECCSSDATEDSSVIISRDKMIVFLSCLYKRYTLDPASSSYPIRMHFSDLASSLRRFPLGT